jgi:hypothetical protein
MYLLCQTLYLKVTQGMICHQAGFQGATGGRAIDDNGGKLALRVECLGVCGKIFYTIGFSIPPTIRNLAPRLTRFQIAAAVPRTFR